MSLDITYLRKQIRVAALVVGFFLATSPPAHADSLLLTFQFHASDVITAIHSDTNFTGYTQVPTGYFALFLQPTSLAYGTYGFCPFAATNCQEPAPINPSTGQPAANGFINTTYSNSANPPEGKGSDSTTWIAFEKAAGSTVTILGDPTSCGVNCSGASLVNSVVSSSGLPGAPVGWGSTSQRISAVYPAGGTADELFQFSLVLDHSVNSVNFQGYASVVAGRTFKGFTEGVGFNMTLDTYSQTVATPEPAGWLLTGCLLLGLAGLGLILRRNAQLRSRA
jgi:hypothetical protein